MKKLILILAVLFYGAQLMAQESDSTKKDTTYTIEWGKKTIIIIDKGNDKVIIEDSDEDEDVVVKINTKKIYRKKRYIGMDFGLNGFVNDVQSVDLRADEKFMDQNYYGSWYVALNFMEKYLPLWEEKVGVMVGMGVEFNKYKLARDYTIVNVSDSTFGIVDSTIDLEKNLFKSTMLNLPVMLETNIGKDKNHSFYLAAGAMLSYRLGSKTKQIFTSDGEDYKTKSRSDYNMNDLRLSLIGRIGYGNVTLFASYSLTPFFQEGRGPELYPFSVGVSLVPF